MEGISPHLKFVLTIRQQLENGESVRRALQHYLKRNTDELSKNISIWLVHYDSGQQKAWSKERIKGHRQRLLLDILARGLRGESILIQLIQTEEELFESTRLELEQFSTLLPLKALVPLLILQFPALLMLLFGPLLRQMLDSF